MRSLIFFIVFLFTWTLYGQERQADSLDFVYQEYEGFSVTNNFKWEYKLARQRVKRVYPLAIEAARIIDSLDREIALAKNNRAQKKITKKAKKAVKEDFKFLIKDLYVSEGQVLTKLIYRETGMTVNEIIKKYGNNFQSFVYSGMAGLFEQDLDSKFDPVGKDFVIECVVQDIISGKIKVDFDVQPLSKSAYKEGMKNYRKENRAQKKLARQNKRN